AAVAGQLQRGLRRALQRQGPGPVAHRPADADRMGEGPLPVEVQPGQIQLEPEGQGRAGGAEDGSEIKSHGTPHIMGQQTLYSKCPPMSNTFSLFLLSML